MHQQKALCSWVKILTQFVSNANSCDSPSQAHQPPPPSWVVHARGQSPFASSGLKSGVLAIPDSPSRGMPFDTPWPCPMRCSSWDILPCFVHLTKSLPSFNSNADAFGKASWRPTQGLWAPVGYCMVVCRTIMTTKKQWELKSG